GPEADQAGLVDGFPRPLPLPLGLEGEVDHHDAVLLYEAHQHDDPYEGVDVELPPEDEEGEQGAEAGEGEGGEDGDRVDEALVEDPEHQVDHEDRRDGQEDEVPEGLLEG